MPTGNPVKTIGGYVPSRLFLGNLTFGIDADGHLTLTRANGSDLGSFIDEGFAVGQLDPARRRRRRPRRQLPRPDRHGQGHHAARDGAGLVGAHDDEPERDDRQPADPLRHVRGQGHRLDDRLDLEGCCAPWLPPCLDDDARSGRHEPDRDEAVRLARRQLPRGPAGRGLRTGGDLRLASRSRSSAATTRRRTTSSSSPPRTTAARPAVAARDVSVLRIAAIVKVTRLGVGSSRFDDSRSAPIPNWYLEQRVVLVADLLYSQPIHAAGREDLPGLDARAVEAAGPARGRGRRHRRRPLAQPRPQAAGREGRPAVRDRTAAARVEADRRPQHLQRRQPAGPHRRR